MTIRQTDDVKSALEQQRPNDILGTPETTWLDFKRTPYQLKTDKGKFDLCHDVSAFANAEGGLIVCGIKATSQPYDTAEIASKLTSFTRTSVNIEQHQAVLSEYLRPRVNVRYDWYDHPDTDQDISGSYLVIKVEPLPEASRYAIIRKVMNVNDRFGEGICIPVRHGDRTVFLFAEDIYQLIKDGLQFRAAQGGEIPLGISTSSLALGDAPDPDRSLRDLEHSQEWDDVPVLFWQSWPHNPPSLLPGLNDADGVRGSLQHQDILRANGFNFSDPFSPPRTNVGAIEIGDRRRAISVQPDGVITAGAVATGEMLSWAMDRTGIGRINIIGVSETALEYYRIADKVIMPKVPGAWQHRIVAVRFQGGQPRQLWPGPNSAFMPPGGPPIASADRWEKSWAASGDPEIDTYECLTRIYALFGLPPSDNPYIVGGRLDTRKLLDAAAAGGG